MNDATPKTSGAVKLIAASLVMLVVMTGYSMFKSSQEQRCRERAMTLSSTSLYTIRDTRWTLTGCEYLALYRSGGDEPRWWSDKLMATEFVTSEM